MTFQPMDQRTLIMLLRTGSFQQVHAYAQKDGWRVILRNRKTTRILADPDAREQIFPTLRDLRDYLYDIAIASFLVDTTALDQSADDVDIRERFNEALQVTVYDEWLSQQVQEALDDPAPSIPNAAVKERAAARRAELLARLEQEKS